MVLLEDIDTAGLTHTRALLTDPVADEMPKEPSNAASRKDGAQGKASDAAAQALRPENMGRISLSALLNVIDGVAS